MGSSRKMSTAPALWRGGMLQKAFFATGQWSRGMLGGGVTALMMDDTVLSNSSAAAKRAWRLEGGVEVMPKLSDVVAMSIMNRKAPGRRHLAMTFSPTSLKVGHSALGRGKRSDNSEEGS